MKTIKHISILLPILFISLFLASCGDNTDGDYKPPEGETSSDKEKELNEKEEFLRLKEEELNRREAQLNGTNDTTTTAEKKDTVKTEEKKEEEKPEKKELVEKEKEINNKLDNPKATIDDYLEYIKRGTEEGGDFDKNMQNASQLWDSRSVGVFKKNYKDTKQFIVQSEPKVVSSDNKTARVKVDIKQIDKDGKESTMTVTYSLVPDSKGKWKIKDNTVIRKN